MTAREATATRSGHATGSGELAAERLFDLDYSTVAPENSRRTCSPRVWVRCQHRKSIQRKLRISLVDKCNLACFFCHNEGQGAIKRLSDVSLSMSNLEMVVRAAVRAGVNNIKLTGGEPLLFKSAPGAIVDLVDRISALRHSIAPFELSMTTNGTLLARMASRLASAGLDRVTISLTTLNQTTFREFISTKTHLLRRMVDGIDEAWTAGLRPIKLNVPIYYAPNRRAGNLDELVDLIDFASCHGVAEVRLFTLIAHEHFPEFSKYYHFFSPEMRAALVRCLEHYGRESPSDTVEVLTWLGSMFAERTYPKVEFGIDLDRVSLTFEAMKHGRLGAAPGHQEGPYAMRLSADGSLRPTLGSAPDYSLIDAINAGSSEDTLRAIYRAAQEEML